MGRFIGIYLTRGGVSLPTSISTPESELPLFAFWGLTPLELVAVDVVFRVMANMAPLTESEVLRFRRVQEEIDTFLGRRRGGWPLEEAFRQADRIPFSVKLQRGRQPAWTVGRIRTEIAWKGLPRPVPSESRIRQALALLCDRGIVQEEHRGAKDGRRVYRLIRLPVSVDELR